jgi:hypothetical protein
MHIYAFGSICRGDLSQASDIDLLAIVDGYDERFDPQIYSIYSYKRIGEIWAEGNPFAWHLHEARPLFLSDGIDHLRQLGKPSPYTKCEIDCTRFQQLFFSSKVSLLTGRDSIVLDLSTIFMYTQCCYVLFARHDRSARLFTTFCLEIT